MTVQRNQLFYSRRSDLTVKATKVLRRTYSDDLVRIVDVVGGKTQRGTGRYVFADSLRRRYFS